MKTQMQVTLLLAAAVYMGWGLSMLLAPSVAHHLLSSGPIDPVVDAMFGISLVSFAVMFLIAARDPVKEIVRAAAAAQGLIGLTAAYLLFITKTMPLGVVTMLSLLVDLAAAGVLFLTEARLDLARHRMRPAARH
ncbi:MAG: hypothetical protein ACYCQK_10525 [Acidiferrobacteraceae bacterium]